MKKKILQTWLLQALLLLMVLHGQAQQRVVIGYVGGFRGLLNTAIINAPLLTHINYAFVNIRNNRVWLANEKTDTVNLRRLQ